MAKVVIFGIQDTAELAHYYLTNDSEHEVVAFSVHRDYIEESSFCGLEIIPFEDVERAFPPEQYKFFAPMTARKMNQLRQSVYSQIKQKGYDFISYISSNATVFSNSIIGDNCFILEDNTVQPFTHIGDNVVLWSGNHIGHHSVIHNHTFFTSHVVLSGHCTVGENCFLGVNSTVRDYVSLAKGTLVGMGSCVNKDTSEWGVYVGSPAKLKCNESFNVY